VWGPSRDEGAAATHLQDLVEPEVVTKDVPEAVADLDQELARGRVQAFGLFVTEAVDCFLVCLAVQEECVTKQVGNVAQLVRKGEAKKAVPLLQGLSKAVLART